MILDKLAKNIVANVGTVIWPLYRIFKERLELIKFEDVKIIQLNLKMLKSFMVLTMNLKQRLEAILKKMVYYVH
jgi:hypothetical protein